MNNTREEYERYIHSSEWREKADKRLERDHHICCVCGKPATDVHHLTYEHFKDERPDDLVSLCRRCHEKAEEIYNPAVTPWAMDMVKPDGNNFMAAMRMDARNVAPIVFDYLKEARGSDFDSLMSLRQPDDIDGKRYWGTLIRAVNALCRKRYSMGCAEDRRDMMLTAVGNHVTTICLAEIEHSVRNSVQSSLHGIVRDRYEDLGKWKAVGEDLGLKNGTLQKLKKDDGTSFGPSLRETVLYYCGLDAAAGIRPAEGFSCLSDEDYRTLNSVADYMAGVSGDGAFKGEYGKGDVISA